MKHHAPSTYGFNDYAYRGSNAQATANWEMIRGIRATGDPVGAAVAAGKHAVDVIGYNTTRDPFVDGTNAINGVYILDPWYGRGNSGLPNWPYNGFGWDSYIQASSWNSLYFLLVPSSYVGTQWDSSYTVVLRTAATTTPVDSPGETYGDWYYRTQLTVPAGADDSFADMSPGASLGDVVPPVITPSIPQAVEAGFEKNGLDTGSSLGVDLTGYTVGASVRVDSVAEELPDYDLVEIRVKGVIRAMALVTEIRGGYAFGALAPVTPEFQLLTAERRASLLAANGLSGTGRLVWAWVDDAISPPFVPLIETRDPQSGAPAYLTASGRLDSLHLVNGLTPRGH
jgi:hypothetical protein